MLIESKYLKYLEETENGYKIKDKVPEKIKNEIKEINEIYEKFYGEELIKI